MEEANEGRRSAFMEHLTLKLENCPKDLLQRFISGNPNRGDGGEEEGEEEEEDAEEIELNLGLSLGGRFGIDRSAKNKLIRSSSIACSIATPHLPRVADFPALVRTSSLPAETEEEWRKRKELQTLRRLAAKRRRSEKQRNSRTSERDPSASAGAERSGFEDDKKELKLVSPVGALPLPPGFPAAAAAVSRLDLSAKGKGGSGGDLQGFGIPTSQGSAESQGGSSAEMSESESKPLQAGSSSCIEARSPASNTEAAGSSGTKINESSSKASGDSPSKKATHVENRGKEVGANAMEDMPCVFTKGDGPEGRRIEGILYKYGKGQEVRIMCVCHGRFLSPAEFVEHAGGTDVAHPLRHIVVNPSAASFL